MDSQLDATNNHCRKPGGDRKPSLTRSQTDSNITYLGDEIPEAPGSEYFMNKDGDMNLEVLVKVRDKFEFKISFFYSGS